MKKVLIIMLALMLAVSVSEAFAAAKANAAAKGQPAKCAAAPSSGSLFQRISDSMDSKGLSPKNQVKPIKKISAFQNMADGIAQGSANAKSLSLRKPAVTPAPAKTTGKKK
ncbi:MAG: hypothetical protein ABH885_06745 [Candidatus Omnitrophota bacterium]